jgi:hypothetical protein
MFEPKRSDYAKKPSARSSQAVKDAYEADMKRYDADMAAWKRNQGMADRAGKPVKPNKIGEENPISATYGYRGSALARLQAKARSTQRPSPAKPAVTEAPAAVKPVSKPKTPSATKPKPEVIKGEVVPSTKGPQASPTTTRDLVTRTGSTVARREDGAMRLPRTGAPRAISGSPRAIGAGTSGTKAAAAVARTNKKQKVAVGIAGAAGLGIALSNKNDRDNPAPTPAQDTTKPSKDVWLDKYGRQISEAEFNRRKAWWAKTKTLDEAAYKKAFIAEGARRKKYMAGAGAKQFGMGATIKTRNLNVPRGVPASTWKKLSDSEKSRFTAKYGNKPLKAAVDWLNNKQNANR